MKTCREVFHCLPGSHMFCLSRMWWYDFQIRVAWLVKILSTKDDDILMIRQVIVDIMGCGFTPNTTVVAD